MYSLEFVSEDHINHAYKHTAPINCCIFCLPTLVFLSIILLNFVFFEICVRRSYQPSMRPHIAPINCCIFCLPTLDFLSIRILSYLIYLIYLILSILSIYLILSYLILSYLILLQNFVFFGIWVRRSYQPSIQPHIIYDSRTTVQATSDGASDITLDAQPDVQSA